MKDRVSAQLVEGDWLGNPANFKGVGYCSLLSKSRDKDPAHKNPKWRRSSLFTVM